MKTLCCGALVVLLLIATSALGQGALVGPADAAFDAGRLDDALALYDKVLADDPTHLHALVRSGMLLSWAGKYDEAVARYDRALEVNPKNYKAQAERAKVLSWSRRFDEAEEAFQAILAEFPEDREARLGLARVYSWGGNQKAARAEYLVLAEKSDADALVGVAQTYAWSGDPASAKGWYERCLEVEPGKLEAVLGLAYIDLWGGDRPKAATAATDLESRFPSNKDVAALRKAVDGAMQTWFRATTDLIEDTDDNELLIYRAELGGSWNERFDYRVNLTRNDMTSRTGSALIDRVAYYMTIHAGAGHRVDVWAGADRTEDTAGNDETEVVGGLAWGWGMGRRTSGSISAFRDTLVYSTDIADARILFDGVRASLTHRIVRDVYLDLAAGGWSLSDENERVDYDGGVRWTPKTGTVTWQIGYAYRFFDYDQDLDNGYFDPQDYSAHLARLGARGTFGSSRATWDILAEGGYQSFTANGIETEDDQTLSGYITLGFPVKEMFVIELFAAHSDSALQSATGFESEQFGVRLRIPTWP